MYPPGQKRPRHAGRRSVAVRLLELSPLVVAFAVVIGAVVVVHRAVDGGGDVAAGVSVSSSQQPLGTTAAPSSSVEPPPTTAAPSSSVEPPVGPVSTGAASPGAASSSAPPVPSTTAPSPVAVRPVTLAFGGDVHFEGSLDGRLREDPGALLQPVAPLLSSADLAVVNLETNVTERGEAEPKEFTFRAPEAAFVALVDAGVDVVSVANNHGKDFGEVGLLDTLDAAGRHPVAVIGGGRNDAEAFRAHRVEVAGRSIAVLGATQVLDAYAQDRWVADADTPGLASAKEPYVQRLLDEVAAEAQRSDTVVVFLHWGRETEVCPTGDQQALARRLVDAGADVVVGGHAHRVQGGGYLGDAVVHYGLGNFVFYTGGGPGTISGVFEVTVDVDDSLTHRWVPARLQGGVATPLTGDEAAEQLAAWEELRGCTDLGASPVSGRREAVGATSVGTAQPPATTLFGPGGHGALIMG